jgi:hypothetical protein
MQSTFLTHFDKKTYVYPVEKWGII